MVYKTTLLQRLLLEIGNLRYVLACGNETSELSHAQYNIYLEQTNFVNEQLENMHTIMSQKYGIDITNQEKMANFMKLEKYSWKNKRRLGHIINLIIVQ